MMLTLRAFQLCDCRWSLLRPPLTSSIVDARVQETARQRFSGIACNTEGYFYKKMEGYVFKVSLQHLFNGIFPTWTCHSRWQSWGDRRGWWTRWWRGWSCSPSGSQGTPPSWNMLFWFDLLNPASLIFQSKTFLNRNQPLLFIPWWDNVQKAKDWKRNFDGEEDCDDDDQHQCCRVGIPLPSILVLPWSTSEDGKSFSV